MGGRRESVGETSKGKGGRRMRMEGPRGGERRGPDEGGGLPGRGGEGR